MEYILKKVCFVDAKGHLRSAPLLLDYIPSYKSFQDAPRVRDLRQVAVSVSQPGKSDASIIAATPMTGRRSTYTVSLQVRSIEPNESGPSSSNSEVGVKAPIVAFPSTFLPTPEGMVKGS